MKLVGLPAAREQSHSYDIPVRLMEDTVYLCADLGSMYDTNAAQSAASTTLCTRTAANGRSN